MTRTTLSAAARKATALAALLLAAPALATTVRLMPLPEMVDQADHIVVARALENRTRTDPQTLYTYTLTTFEVVEQAKGGMRAGELIDVEILGGAEEGAGFGTFVADAPRFQTGETVLLFTAPRTETTKNLVGFWQGAVRLTPDPGAKEGEESWVVPSPPPNLMQLTAQPVLGTRAQLHRQGEPAPLVPSQGSAVRRSLQPTAPATPARRGVTLESLLSTVRTLGGTEEEGR